MFLKISEKLCKLNVNFEIFQTNFGGDA